MKSGAGQTQKSRRSFLKAAGATAVGGRALVGGMLGGFPMVVRAQDKAGAQRPVLGLGEHTYEAIHDWGSVPEHIRYGNTHGVCEDSQGRIYVHHTVGAGSQREDTMVVFDADGKFVKSWGPQHKGGAHGLHIFREGAKADGSGGQEFLYLCDYAHHIVVKTDLNGEVVWTLKAPEQSGKYTNPAEYKPTNVAIAPNGDLYVADGYGKNWIHQYNAKAEYMRTFGGQGAEAGQVNCPHGLMVDTRGKEPMLVVADRSNRRLQHFTLDGKHSGFVTAELRSPCHFDEHKGVLLIPDLEARVTLFDRDNKLIAHLGDGGSTALREKPREQFIPGKFIAPHGACFDHAGNIFVVEWVEVGRVTKLQRV